MASAQQDEGCSSINLTDCSICLSLLDDPKALPCLHTFCLKCLIDYTKGRKQGTIICPLCREETQLPASGVDGYRTNFLINKLKDKRELQQQLKEPQIPCTNCGKPERFAVSRCLECCDFLCKKCNDSHSEIRALRSHRLCTLEEMRSGQIALQTVPEEEYCEKHKGQVLWFYCKTCDKLICRDCSVVDHCKADHDFVTLESATQEQKEEILKLLADCRALTKSLDSAVEQNQSTKNDLDVAVQGALQTINKTKDKILQEFGKTLETCCEKHVNEIREWQAKVKQNISKSETTLQNQQARLTTTLEMAKQVTEQGSKYDIAEIHTELTHSLKQLNQIKPSLVNSNLSHVTFMVNKDYTPEVPNIGNLNLGKIRTWEFEKQFGDEGPGKLQSGNGIVICPSSDITVTDRNAAQVKVYTSDGQFKHSLDTKEGLKSGEKSQPAGIVCNTNGDYYITDWSQYVKVYNAKGQYRFKFPAISPNNTPSHADDDKLVGLALDNNGHILVGACFQQYISTHHMDGKHISSIKVDKLPMFHTVLPNNNIVICNFNTVHIIDSSGHRLHTLNPPPGVASWRPADTCYSEDILFITNNTDDTNAGIYCYSMTGDYLGCAAKEVTRPRGLAITDDGCKLIVIDDGKNVKIFHLK